MFAKLEMFDPSGSVKDRPSLNILKNALKNGDIKKILHSFRDRHPMPTVATLAPNPVSSSPNTSPTDYHFLPFEETQSC
jgi:hypothetical protein